MTARLPRPWLPEKTRSNAGRCLLRAPLPPAPLVPARLKVAFSIVLVAAVVLPTRLGRLHRGRQGGL